MCFFRVFHGIPRHPSDDFGGLAFGLVSNVLAFLKEGVSLSMDALGVLTTSPVPIESHGLLPVSNIRFPAMYLPTQEH